MPRENDVGGTHSTPKLNGSVSITFFVLMLLGFVGESQLTQYVQANLGYRQPYFIMYIVHSSFVLLLPIHLLFLQRVHHDGPQSLLRGLVKGISLSHGSSKPPPPGLSAQSMLFIASKLSARLVLALTITLTLPALLWFFAISLASVSDVTALWNTNAFWCWVISVIVFRRKWERRPLVAVVLATCGVFIVVYGGSSGSESPSTAASSVFLLKPSAPLAGDLMTLVASILYGAYQVGYKKFTVLPTDIEAIATDDNYEAIREEDTEALQASEWPDDDVGVYPPPFGLYPNFLSASIGLYTIVLFWIPIPILHFLDVERFHLPPDLWTILSIAAISACGLVFNGTFMILLRFWGPVVTSVGNLLTIVLVMLTDVLFGGGLGSLTIWSLIGGSVIVFSFGILAYDIMTTKRTL